MASPERIELRSYVPDDELEDLYGAARAFAFLSDYEGFALTPFEAIAHGVPPILLDTPVAREIYGDAARLVPPEPAAIGDAIATLLTDDAAHTALSAAGAGRLPAFSWSRTAAAALHALETAAER